MYTTRRLYITYMTPKEVLRILTKEGWYVARVNGSHHILRHPDRPEARTVVAMHRGDLKLGTLKAIERDTGVRLK